MGPRWRGESKVGGPLAGREGGRGGAAHPGGLAGGFVELPCLFAGGRGRGVVAEGGSLVLAALVEGVACLR